MAGSSMNISPADLAESLSKTIAASHLRRDPFDHIIVEDIFPGAVYQAIQSSMPETKLFNPISAGRTSNANALESRRLLRLTANDFEQLSQSQKETWGVIRAAICGKRFFDAAFSKFAAGLTERYGSINAQIGIRLEIVRDSKGYMIEPHTDAPHKLLTFIFYMPPDENHLDLGTSIYRPKYCDLVDDYSRTYPFEEFEEVHRVPYKPNTLFGFLKTERSFHGREFIDIDVERNWMN